MSTASVGRYVASAVRPPPWTTLQHHQSVEFHLSKSDRCSDNRSHLSDTLRATFESICAIDADDGVRYDAQGMKITPIREDNLYGGSRLSLLAFVGNARLPVQVDIGFGDVITPSPEFVSYPTLLDCMDAPHLRAYPVYTVVAEKFHAMVELGINNSRMKDFFDLAVIARTSALDGAILIDALRATFARRGTALPTSTPIALTPEFAATAAKVHQWDAFVNKARLQAHDLSEIVALLNAFLQPPMHGAYTGRPFDFKWNPTAHRWTQYAFD